MNNYDAMKSKPDTPKVGVSVLLIDKKGYILLGKRKGSHGAGQWGAPGGHMEIGEEFDTTCKREVKEEIGIDIDSYNLWEVGFTNDHFPDEGLHYVTLAFLISAELINKSEIVNMEPEKCERWEWFHVTCLPLNTSPCVSKMVEKMLGEGTI
jgi:8-oxo-dGTP diphosphatase